MSKYVKDLITSELRKKLDGVDDALLVNVIGMPNERTVQLRRDLRQKAHQPDGGEEQPGAASDGRNAARAGV